MDDKITTTTPPPDYEELLKISEDLNTDEFGLTVHDEGFSGVGFGVGFIYGLLGLIPLIFIVNFIFK